MLTLPLGEAVSQEPTQETEQQSVEVVVESDSGSVQDKETGDSEQVESQEIVTSKEEGQDSASSELVEGQDSVAPAQVEPEAPAVDLAIQQEFLLAITEENYNAIVTLIGRGANVNYTDNFLQLPLKVAVDGRNVAIINHLIKEGAEPNVMFSVGEYNQRYETNLLIYAIKLGYSEVVLALLDSGANPNVLDSNNKSAFFIAAEKGSRKDIIRLKNAGANHLIQDPKSGLSSAHVAIRKGFGHIFELLYEIDNSFMLMKDKGGRLPVHYAACMNDSDLLEFIIEEDASMINAKDGNNRVPLHYAAGKGNVNSVRSLILAGADVNAVDKWNMNSLHFSVMSSQPDVAIILIQAGVDPYLKDKIKGETPLDLALKKNMTSIIPVLQNEE
ncbi:MAG: ankyrin repeat domain-containing protein [Rickettsiales bacterium]|nr:ankyrin repeat domain-containing protein [Rickettsiales bacterium]